VSPTLAPDAPPAVGIVGALALAGLPVVGILPLN
jgi:hypothetical protein